MMMGTSEPERIVRHRSRPETSGSIRSRMTRAGGSARNRSRALRPSVARLTRYPSRSRLYRTVSARETSSSTTRIRTLSVDIGDDAAGVRGVGELPELPREQERNLLGDVDRVVSDALEGSRGKVHVHPPVERLRIARELRHLEVHVPVEAIHGVVHRRQPKAHLHL